MPIPAKTRMYTAFSTVDFSALPQITASTVREFYWYDADGIPRLFRPSLGNFSSLKKFTAGESYIINLIAPIDLPVSNAVGSGTLTWAQKDF